MITPETLANIAAAADCTRIVIQTHLDPVPLQVAEAWVQDGTLVISLDVAPPPDLHGLVAKSPFRRAGA